MSFRGRGGFTLVELMAAIVIIALAAGVILPGIAAADDAARCKATVAKLRDLDRTARLLARSEGRVAVGLDHTTQTFVLTAIDASEPFAVVATPTGTSVALHVEGDHQFILFNRAGRSPDYAIEVTRGAHVITYAVAGATGHINEVEQ